MTAPELPNDLFERPTREAVRRIALVMLDDAEKARDRLGDRSDTEALHDFRVAIRRLRSVLRAFSLDGIKRKHEKRLRDVQNATGKGRDAEVLLEWLEEQREEMRGRKRAGFEWLVERLRAVKDAAYDGAVKEADARFPELRERLAPQLETMVVHVSLLEETPTSGPPFALDLAVTLRDHARRLAERLARVRGPEDVERAHAARIAGKRLRYVLEATKDELEAARDVLARMKGLQDVLGRLNDSHVFAHELIAAIERSASEREARLAALAAEGEESAAMRRELRRSEQVGLLDLGMRVQQRIEALFEQLTKEWLEGGVDQLVVQIEAIAAELEVRGRAGREIERKYLLRGLPEVALRHAPQRIAQGYLPGEALVERVRKIEGDGETRHVRTMKLGRGVTRIEVEEEIDAALFEGLWALTVGQRVTKRRYRVPEGELVWEIDEFLDRDLVLAEVELPREDMVVSPPAWLAEHVVREVTTEGAYVNASLARTPGVPPESREETAAPREPGQGVGLRARSEQR